MKSARKNGTKKRRGRPATGQGVQIGTRWPESTVEAIDKWAAGQADKPGRSEAVRRLVELGLAVKARPRQLSPTQAAKLPAPPRVERANTMAAEQLDRLTDQSASTEDQASRKRDLLKGPEEFRKVRVDRVKAKAK
jgi:hypothetical protein